MSILSELAQERYQEYLKSDYWIKFRESVFNNYEFQYCWHCGCDTLPFLLLHHLNYNLYYEIPGIDIIPLCQNCHAKIHEKTC